MVSRRQLMSTGVAVGAATWVAPSVISVDPIAAATGSCSAQPPTTTEGVDLIDPPPDVATLASNTKSYVWLETESEVLDNDLVVNRATAGTFSGNSHEAAIIPANTEISSYLIHGDRLDNEGQLSGTITFSNAEIIGVIYQTDELNASNFLASPASNAVAAPSENSDDMVLDLSGDAHSLSWTMRFGASNDNIRVIVSCG